MTRSLFIFLAAFAGAYALAGYCKRERDRERAAETPRPGAAVPLAPDAGTVEARGGAAVVLNTDKNKHADADASAVFTAPDA